MRRGAEWPGLWSSPEQIGGSALVVRRPKVFFDPKSYLPETTALELTAPRGFASAEEFRSLLAEALSALEEKHRAAAASGGHRFLGAARVLAQSPFARPRGGEPRFDLRPRIAARDNWRRIEGIQRLKTFLQAYREAWEKRRSGVVNVVFPAGTYLLRILHGVQCAGAA